MAFDAVKKNAKFGRIQCQRREQQQGNETSISLQKESESKVIPVSILKIGRRGALVGAKDHRKWDG